jgi:two-component SAPR family response regulator
MPGENGLDFADRFHAVHPCVPVLMVTAHWERKLQRQVLHRDNLYLLCKPVDHVLLSRLVDDLCVDRSASPAAR